MATRKTNAKSKAETQPAEKPEGVTLEKALKEEGEGRTPDTININGKKRTGTSNTDQATKTTEQSEDGVTLEQALKEEGEGRTPETIKKSGKKVEGSTKMEKATKIMEEMWDDIQSGKVKRKDVIARFMEEVPLSKAGSSTYYGTIKKKLSG